jgi:hypothetical protein
VILLVWHATSNFFLEWQHLAYSSQLASHRVRYDGYVGESTIYSKMSYISWVFIRSSHI